MHYKYKNELIVRNKLGDIFKKSKYSWSDKISCLKESPLRAVVLIAIKEETQISKL